MQGRVQEGDTTITLTGTPREFEDLFNELHSWTPSRGWSDLAETFFELLKGATL